MILSRGRLIPDGAEKRAAKLSCWPLAHRAYGSV